MKQFLKNMVSAIKTPTIEFLCEKDDFGVIPEPFPSRKLMPEWFKALPPRAEKKEKLKNSTIKRCAPFLDAMTVGWIIPLAADVEFITNGDASECNYQWSFYKPMIENHSKEQLSSPNGPPHPSSPKPPMKFMNYWMIKVPEDYSVLFLPPLNRTDPRFECIAGMVDADGYFEYINFPFFFKTPNYTGILKAGTPLVQCIPIKRDALIKNHEINQMSEQDTEDRALVRRKRASHESLYRDSIWERK